MPKAYWTNMVDESRVNCTMAVFIYLLCYFVNTCIVFINKNVSKQLYIVHFAWKTIAKNLFDQYKVFVVYCGRRALVAKLSPSFHFWITVPLTTWDSNPNSQHIALESLLVHLLKVDGFSWGTLVSSIIPELTPI